MCGVMWIQCGECYMVLLLCGVTVIWYMCCDCCVVCMFLDVILVWCDSGAAVLLYCDCCVE